MRVDDTAHCVGQDPERFFPRKGASGRALQETKAICLDPPCPFLDPCREWGLAHEIRGIWGGKTESERRKERRARGEVVASPTWAESLAMVREGEKTTCWQCGKSLHPGSLRRHEDTYH